MPYLKLLHGKDSQVHVLSRDVTTLGRAGEADIAIRGDRGVSKLHARIETEASGYVIVDLGSRNGTYVNDHPIGGEPAPLLPGDRIRLGRSVFVFEGGEPEGTVPEERTDDLQAPASLFRADQLPYTMAVAHPP